MEVRGEFERGLPVVTGRLIFDDTGLATVDTRFVIDCGSAPSLYVPAVQKSFEPQFADFAQHPSIVLGGVGGTTEARLVSATLMLDGVDVRVTIRRLFAVADPDSMGGLPSLLGRDILDFVHLTLDRSINLVSLSDPHGAPGAGHWPDEIAR